VSPGNHDPTHHFSYHDPEYFKAKTGRTHPRNVCVFGSPRIERRTIAALPDVDFYGCAFEANVPRSERLLSGLKPQRPDSLNVLVLHGSLDDQLPGTNGEEITLPFSRAELLATGFDYAALGHYHRPAEIRDDAGMIRGAYGGAPMARGLDEAGDRAGFVLVGEIAPGGVRPETLERIRVAPRRILRVETEIDAAILNEAAARGLIEAAMVNAGAGKQDIVHVTLRGRTNPDITRFEFDSEWLDRAAFHLVVDQSALEPDYDIDGMLRDATAGKRIEGQFVARLRQMMIDAGDDPDRQQLLRQAMVVGLDALHGREVRPRHAS
jgi:DNA repair exonuclease SbcCD nuclease subunit